MKGNRKKGIYEKYVKRQMDFILSLMALIILSPVLVVLTIIGTFAMKGNPFFIQPRPGRDEKIFKLVKFRTMSNAKDKDGNLLPDELRLNKYGKFLRSTSLDELPELWNIFIGDMSIVGPRPLAVQYLPYYNENERKRHEILPGLTGLAQINGRNCVNWPKRFAYDVEYVEKVSFMLDVKIILKTILKVFKRSGVSVRATGEIIDFDKYRILENKSKLVKNNGTDEKK